MTVFQGIHTQQTPLRAFLETLGGLQLLIATGLWFDSKFYHGAFDGQTIINIAMIVAFGVLFYFGTARARTLMIFATLIGIGGEYLFSLGFEMYTYKNGNVPMYVPPGHAIVYICVYWFTRRPAIVKTKAFWEKSLLVFAIGYSLFCLIVWTDVFGFLLTGLTLYLLKKHPRERLFYLAMYFSVAILEFIGTRYECWYWPPVAFGEIDFLPSANAPSGISFFYFGLDLGSLWFYKHTHPKAWARKKKVQQLRAAA